MFWFPFTWIVIMLIIIFKNPREKWMAILPGITIILMLIITGLIRLGIF